MSNWKWTNFHPKVSGTDKRDRDGAVSKGEKFVEKNFNELALSSFVAVPVVDHTRSILNVKMIYPPKSPLEAFWKSKENKEFINKFIKSMEDTQLWALELWDAKENDDQKGGNTFYNLVGGDEDCTKEEDEIKPDKPIFTMNTAEMYAYFPRLLKYLYKREGLAKYKLWAKKSKQGDILEEPTKLKIYDTKAEAILPRNDFIGSGSGGPNIGNRLRMVSSYLLRELGFDHNSYCKELPPLYKDVIVDFDNFEEFVLGKKAKPTKPPSRLMLAKINAAKKRKVIQAESEDDDASIDSRKRMRENPDVDACIADEEGSSSRTPSVAATRPCFSTTSSTLGTPRNLLDLLRSRPVIESPGTPANETECESLDESNEEEDDRLINKDIDLVKEGNVMKAHGGLITTVNVFDVEICDSNGFFRASISDGKDRSNKVLFNAKLNEQIENELVGPGKVSVVKLDITDILEKTIVGVMAYTRLGDGPKHVGDAKFLGDSYYRSLKPRGCMTPSRMKKTKLFK